MYVRDEPVFPIDIPWILWTYWKEFADPIKYDEAIRIILPMLVIEEDEEGEGHHHVTELDFLSVFISILFFGVLEPLNVTSSINIT